MDQENKTVRVEPGVTGEELDHETTTFGFATTIGTVGDTGVSGLILHGGWAWIGKKYGWGVDNIVSADVVDIMNLFDI